MLKQLSLTDEEKEALEGDRDAVAALIERLADIPAPPDSPRRRSDQTPHSSHSARSPGLTGLSQHRQDV